MNNLIYQQGDCILKRVGKLGVFNLEYDKIPKEAKTVKTNLVLKGTTNSHALYGGKYTLKQTSDGTLFLKVTKATTLDHVKDHNASEPEHAEHHAQLIEPGEYFIAPLMEYDHLKEESRRVVD
jgi:hypothetical protein